MNENETTIQTKENLEELWGKRDCFSGQRQEEQVESILIRHWIVLAPAFILLVVFIFIIYIVSISFADNINETISFFFSAIAPNKIILIFNFLLISILLHIFFVILLNYYLTIVIITNLRIIDVKFSVFFQRNVEILDMHNIQDINMVKRGFWRWLLNYGRIIMHNASGSELFHFTYLKNPLKNYNIINHVHFNVINKHTESQKTETAPQPTSIEKEELIDS